MLEEIIELLLDALSRVCVGFALGQGYRLFKSRELKEQQIYVSKVSSHLFGISTLLTLCRAH